MNITSAVFTFVLLFAACTVLYVTTPTDVEAAVPGPRYDIQVVHFVDGRDDAGQQTRVLTALGAQGFHVVGDHGIKGAYSDGNHFIYLERRRP